MWANYRCWRLSGHHKSECEGQHDGAKPFANNKEALRGGSTKKSPIRYFMGLNYKFRWSTAIPMVYGPRGQWHSSRGFSPMIDDFWAFSSVDTRCFPCLNLIEFINYRLGALSTSFNLCSVGLFRDYCDMLLVIYCLSYCGQVWKRVDVI